MTIINVIQSGHKSLRKAFGEIPEEFLNRGFVKNSYTVKDLLARTTALEHITQDVLKTMIDPTAFASFALRRLDMGKDNYCDYHIKQMRPIQYVEILAEYKTTHDHILKMLPLIHPDLFLKPYLIPWLGKETVFEYLIQDARDKKKTSRLILNFKAKANKTDHSVVKNIF